MEGKRQNCRPRLGIIEDIMMVLYEHMKREKIGRLWCRGHAMRQRPDDDDAKE